jgi:peptidyl-prolyl cis-trans isomerase C
MQITVNGVEIPESAVASETQNHPAETPVAAREEAARALVVRELLLQEARRLEYRPDPAELGDGRRETDEESLIRQLLDCELETPEADEAACRRYYENNGRRFVSPALYEAAHIFFPAPPEDEAARAEARKRAEATIEELEQAPERFAALAKARSACSSAQDGGALGQVTRGQTAPELESFFDALEPGQISPVPVESRYGVHIVRLDDRQEGRRLPFEAVRDRIAEYLNQQVWQRAVSQYISILAGRAEIEGFEMPGATSPLVQ